MRSLLPFLLVSWMLPFAPCQTNSPQQPPNPLNESEKRQVLSQLISYRSALQTISAYEDFVRREQELYEKEKAGWQRQIDLEKQATALALKDRDLEKQRAEFYEQMYKTAIKKPRGFGCLLKKIFSLGIARCQ